MTSLHDGIKYGTNIVEANPQQEKNFVFLSPFHSIFLIYTPSMLSERVSVSLVQRERNHVLCNALVAGSFSSYGES